MGTRICATTALIAWPLIAQVAAAGDPLKVFETVQMIPSTWKEAYFSIDVRGPSSAGEVILGHEVELGYEAAINGHVAYLRIASHGDMTLSRDAIKAPTAKGKVFYTVEPPLGTELLIVIFSSDPLDALFPSGGNSRGLGADSAGAEAFVKQLSDIEAGGIKIATRRYHYLVAASNGGTEYTTRGIEFQIDHARRLHIRGSDDARFPSHIEFEFDSDRLTNRGKLDLDQFGEVMAQKIRDGAVVLEGHTDAVGSDEYNNALSWRRAAAAKQYLIESFGIPPARLSVDGKGKEGPLKPNDNDADRRENRRVDIIFESPHLPESSH